MDVRFRVSEGCDPQPLLLWDSVWNANLGVADWALAGSSETLNRGGLAATRALHSAVVLALFTDRRVPDTHPLRYLAGNDPRGWWGDGIDVRDDLGEDELGSLLWLLERAPLTDEIVRWAETMAIEALNPLLRQGVVVRIEAEATGNVAALRLELVVRLFGRDGSKAFDGRFEILWNQTR